MKTRNLFLMACLTLAPAFAGDMQAGEKAIPRLAPTVTTDYLRTHLHPTQPRLVLTADTEARLRERLKSDPVVKNVYEAIRLNANEVFDKPLLKREMIGRRLLSTSREMLWRMNVLGVVYRLEKEPRVLARINQELIAVCEFKGWNPSHFLDVGEMALAVALALDWTAGDLPETTRQLAREALVKKALKAEGRTLIMSRDNNWNQVCNGGMIAAALAVADEKPELAASVIRRALEALPNALVHYGPDGAHPEAATYWEYASGYTAIISSMLASALGTDFGIWAYPGLEESALYRVLMNTPTGDLYNYGDCGSRRRDNGDLTLAWFAAKSGDRTFYEQERFLRPPVDMGRLKRWAGMGLIWLSQYEPTRETSLPAAWAGRGMNPVVVFRGEAGDAGGYYFGAKGGCGAISHGNLDAGSFILEMNGVRWALDMGGQGYHALEKTGFNLWDSRQQGDRWKLLTKNNRGHSTLTVNGTDHRVDGHVELIAFEESPVVTATFDLTPAFGDLVSRVTRTFSRDSASSLLVTDMVKASKKTRQVTWQMLTTAEVEVEKGQAHLSQGGERLTLTLASHPGAVISVVSLDPPPLKLDRRIKGLKRIDIDIPLEAAGDDGVVFQVRLADGKS